MPASTVPTYYDSKGSRLVLGKKIGSGGEGDVFDIVSSGRKFVAKIYHKPLEIGKQEKLRLMVRGCNAELKGIAAWPTDTIYSGQNGPVRGFIMPKISGYEPVHKIYGPSHRKELYPCADWKFLIRTAKNLAAAFHVLHKFGYIIGDVNEGNILVNDEACVQLIDCDSFQVPSKECTYYCEVGVAHFTPPEIQKSGNFKMQRSKNHDNFGLAILIFQLLFMGRHPYSGVYRGREDMPIEKAIIQHRFAYGKFSHKRSISPPPNSVGLSIVPAELAELFERAFSETGVQPGGRPSAAGWWNVLEDLEQHLKRCGRDSVHYYYKGLVKCPWCTFEDTSGVLPFLSAESISKMDLTAEWRKVMALKPPGPAHRISPEDYPFRPDPLPADLEKSFSRTKLRFMAGGVILAGGGIAGYLVHYLVLVAALIVAEILFLHPGKEFVEKKRRKNLLENTQYSWRLWTKKWHHEAGDDVFRMQLDRLFVLKSNYETIEKEYKNALASLQYATREWQQKKFLEQYTVKDSVIPHIREDQIIQLRSYGIRTAADITRSNLAGRCQLDRVQIGELLSWSKNLEKLFLFDPSKGPDKSDTMALIHRFQPRLKPVERELQSGINQLIRTHREILYNRAKFQPLVEKSAKELSQAEVNVRAMKILGIF
ncbi:MAG: hypothetical protein WAK10_08485 [Methanoregula sp.]